MKINERKHLTVRALGRATLGVDVNLNATTMNAISTDLTMDYPLNTRKPMADVHRPLTRRRPLASQTLHQVVRFSSR